MALTDITPPPGDTDAALFARGNTGTPTDVQGEPQNMMFLPEVTGGGGNVFIMSI